MIKPDFTNEEGVKWWKESALTSHAKESLGDKYSVWSIEKADGAKSLVLIDGMGVLKEKNGIEEMAYAIDFAKLARDKT